MPLGIGDHGDVLFQETCNNLCAHNSSDHPLKRQHTCASNCHLILTCLGLYISGQFPTLSTAFAMLVIPTMEPWRITSTGIDLICPYSTSYRTKIVPSVIVGKSLVFMNAVQLQMNANSAYFIHISQIND